MLKIKSLNQMRREQHHAISIDDAEIKRGQRNQMKKSFNEQPRVLEDAKNFALRQPKSKSKSPCAPQRRNTLQEREMREAFTG